MFRDLKDLFKNKINKENLSELIWVGLGQVINLLFGFGIVKIISRMGTNIFGEYALLLTAAAFIGMTFYGPVTQGFIRYYYHYKKENILGAFIKLIYKVLVYSGSIVFLIAVLLSLTMNFTTGSAIFVYILFGIFAVSLKLDDFFNSYLNIIRERKRNSILQSIEKFLIVAALFLLLVSKIITLYKAIAIYSFLIITFMAVKYFYLKKYHKEEMLKPIKNGSSENKKMMSNLFLYIYPFFIWGLSGWLQLNGEKWIIAKFLSTSDVGIYAVMMSLINALIVAPNTAVSDFVSPIVFQKFSDLEDRQAVHEGVRVILLVMFFLLLLVIFTTVLTYYYGKELIILISGEHFTEYFKLLPFLAAGSGLFYLGQASSFIGMGLNKPQKYLSPKITVGVLSVIFNIYFINLLGISGVVVTILLIGIIYFAYVTFINLKMLKEVKVF